MLKKGNSLGGSDSLSVNESEVIIELGAEGGSITLSGFRTERGWSFSMTTNEFFFDEGELKKSAVVDSWKAALELLDKFPWACLCPISIHSEFKQKIWVAVQERLRSDSDISQSELEKWREMCRPSGLLGRLGAKEQRGSKPRCHFLTHGTKEQVARRLTSIIDNPRGWVSPSDRWMPIGFEATEEAQLHKAESLIASSVDRLALKKWWLADPKPTSRTPTWDIVSTCSIGGKAGLLLIEAKAHQAELIAETRGKKLNKNSNEANHRSIGRAIDEANEGLQLATKMDWHLSSARCYQMSNRFAWAWKLCMLGYPVALVYLGFIGAREMPKPFSQKDDWDNLVKGHSAPLFRSEIWNRGLDINGSTFLPLIRTSLQPLQCV